MKNFILFSALILLGLGGTSLISNAQLNNKPFSFKGTPDGSVGISIGGRQAILNQKLSGITAENLVRTTGGELLDVRKGLGGIAIVNFPNGAIIPSFYGTSYKGDNVNMSVGVFNSYFSPDAGKSSNPPFMMSTSSATVNTWTSRVVSGGYPTSYSPSSSVDAWTAQVY